MAKYLWLFAVSAISFIGPAMAGDVTVQIVNYGMVQRKPLMLQNSSDATSTSGKGEQEVTFQRTDQVPLESGVRFGVFILASNPKLPNGQTVTLRKVTRFPSPGLTNPETRKTILSEAVPITLRTGEPQGPFGFGLDHDWELIPGTWKVEFWLGDEKLAEQAFVLTKQ